MTFPANVPTISEDPMITPCKKTLGGSAPSRWNVTTLLMYKIKAEAASVEGKAPADKADE